MPHLIQPVQHARALIALLAAGFLLVLAGCAPGVGSSGTGYADGSQSGTVTGYGSIIVESNRYDDSSAEVTIEDGAGSSRAAAVADIELGMQVLVDFDQNDVATQILITPQLVGRVDAVSTSGLIVAGQTVIVSNRGIRPTVREGFETLAELAGRRVTVYGQFSADGALLATRIERRPTLLDVSTRVTGVVSSVPSADEVVVGNLAIRAPAQNWLPAGSVPVVGDTITAFADAAPQGGVLAASGGVVRNASRLAGEAVRIGNIIRRVEADGTLVVGSVRVDTSNAEVVTSAGSASISDLSAGLLVRVSGRRSNNTLVADRITLVSGQGETITVRGLIDDFFATDHFRVRGVLIDASAASFAGGASGNLLNNVAVAVSGELVNGRLNAQTVQLLFGELDGIQTLFGEIRSYNATTGNLALLGQPANVSAQTQITSLTGTTLDPAVLQNDVRVIARGTFTGGVFGIDQLIVLNSGDNPTRQVSGIAYAVNTGAQQMRVGRVVVQWDAQTTFTGNQASLAGGSRVRVLGRAVAGGLLAERIEIR